MNTVEDIDLTGKILYEAVVDDENQIFDGSKVVILNTDPGRLIPYNSVIKHSTLCNNFQ